jgi:hypothetical protein
MGSLCHWTTGSTINNARSRAYLEQDIIRVLFQEHVNGVREHGYRMWVLLNFELWLRMFEEEKPWTPRRAEAHKSLEIVGVQRHSYAKVLLAGANI